MYAIVATSIIYFFRLFFFNKIDAFFKVFFTYLVKLIFWVLNISTNLSIFFVNAICNIYC
jgi:hypothetical protein